MECLRIKEVLENVIELEWLMSKLVEDSLIIWKELSVFKGLEDRKE